MKGNARQSPPPALCEAILASLTTSATRCALLGDMAERHHLRAMDPGARPNRGYWLEAIGLMPFLLSSRIRQATGHGPVQALVILAGVPAFALLWELSLVQRSAWPVTASIMDHVEVPARTLYFILYAALNVLGALGMALVYGHLADKFSGVDAMRRERRCALICFLLGAPSVYFLACPLEVDSPIMRVGQLAILISISLVLHRFQRAHKT